MQKLLQEQIDHCGADDDEMDPCAADDDDFYSYSVNESIGWSSSPLTWEINDDICGSIVFVFGHFGYLCCVSQKSFKGKTQEQIYKCSITYADISLLNPFLS